MKRILTLTCLGLNVLCVFVAFFEHSISLPSWMLILGRLHPLVLHVPIGISIVLLVFFWIKEKIDKESSSFLFENLLLLLAFFSVLSAFAGLVLSFEPGYDKEQLKFHKYSGLIVSVLVYLIYEFQTKIFLNRNLSLVSIFGVFGLMSFVGHLGGNITHGDDFLFPYSKKEADPTVFGQFVNPILQEKCKSCHNPQKAKGGLDITSIEKIKKGGKNGPLWVGLDTLNSHILKSAALDIEDKKHMPPKGKPQLTASELLTIKNWIAEGASYDLRVDKLKPNSFFNKLAAISAAVVVAKTYEFSSASESTVKDLNTPFCTVAPYATGSPALKANFYVSSKFDKNTLSSLSKVKEQLVSLNLSKMPVGDEVFDIVSQFSNLEYLNLNQTDITGKGIEKLIACKNLERLSMSNTKIDYQSLEKILKMPSLKHLFLWETKISTEQLEKLKKGKITIETGYVPDESEKLKLNAPILVNESSVIEDKTPIIFKHTLKDVNIRYTLDGTDPDSVKSAIYTKPLFLETYGPIKVRATKNGWLASEIKQVYFFKSNYKATSATLILKADTKYQGNGAMTIIDGKQGDAKNFNDKSWLGFRENNFESKIVFDKLTDMKGFTLSYAEKADSFIMPPEWVDIWVKEESKDFVHLRKVSIPQLTKITMAATKGLDIVLNLKNIKEVKIVAKPLAKLPSWHPGKGQKGWFFIDEVFFY